MLDSRRDCRYRGGAHRNIGVGLGKVTFHNMLGTSSGVPGFPLTLIHPSAWNKDSRKFTSKILHNPAPIPLESPTPDTPHSPVPLELVTPMDRYAGSWMRPSTNKCLRLRENALRPAPLPAASGTGQSGVGYLAHTRTQILKDKPRDS